MANLREITSDSELRLFVKDDAQNLKWLYKNFEKLLRDYSNRYIAIRNQEIIDHDLNVRDLIVRLENKLPRTDDVLIYFLTPHKIKLLF